jgi:hypothetical protein
MSGGSLSRRAALNTTLALTDDEERTLLDQVPPAERQQYAAWLAGDRNAAPLPACALCPGPATHNLRLRFARPVGVCHLHWEIAGRVAKPAWRMRLDDLRYVAADRR